jgi:hypothetical protein
MQSRASSWSTYTRGRASVGSERVDPLGEYKEELYRELRRIAGNYGGPGEAFEETRLAFRRNPEAARIWKTLQDLGDGDGMIEAQAFGSGPSMLEPIDTYHVVSFASPLEASVAGARIQALVLSPRGTRWQTGANRAVIWTGALLAKEGTLYLSPGALHAAHALGLKLNPTRQLGPKDLPASRALLLGDASD